MGTMINTCGAKLRIMLFSFHFKPTYVQPAMPTSCSMLFQGVMPATCRTIAKSMITALVYFTQVTTTKLAVAYQ